MPSWEEIAQRYTIRFSDKIRNSTKPLRDHFGINCFFHIRIDNQGKLIWLGDRPDCAEYYVNNKYYINDPCMTHPSNWESGFSLLKSVASDVYNKTFLSETENLFNLNSWIVFCEKTFEFVSIFGFVSEKTNFLEKIYLNHPNILKMFSHHFKKEMHSIICQMEEEQISLVDLNGNKFFPSGVPIQPTLSPSTYKAFLKDISMTDVLKKAALLSQRERQCLKLLLLQKSAKETAAELNLSPRTIEFYFENIKNKLTCNNKNEVFGVSKELNELGLL